MGYKHSTIKRWFYITWHKFTSRRFSFKLLIFQTILLGTWCYAFIIPALRSGKIDLKLAFGGVIAYIFYGILKNYPVMPNLQRKHFTKQKIARKIMTADILDKMTEHNLANLPRSDKEGIPLLEEILQVIADHVRTYRYDREGEKIFCNLLIEYEYEYLKVIARNRTERRGYPIYKKSDMQAWTSMTHKRVYESGDIFIDFPSTPAGKPYKSVLTIPIIYKDYSIAVLSIDSSEPYHFTGIEETINTRLLSYSVLLKKVLLEYNIVKLKKGVIDE